MQLSGTSFAAPVVSGTVAIMLARNPELTPDQVKGALMVTARAVQEGGGKGRRRRRDQRRQGDRRGQPAEPERRSEQVRRPDGDGTLAFDAFSWRRAARVERVVELGVLEQRFLELGLVELGVLEQRVLELGLLELRVLELGFLEQRVLELGLVELRLPRGRRRPDEPLQ